LSLDASVQQIRQVAKWANRLFTYTNTDIIYGLAGETREELLRDASEALALGTTTVDFYPINNLSAQPRMHKAADAAGCETLAASVKMTYRMLLDQFMLSQNYVPISGYAYAVATDADAPAHVRESPRFLYHDIIYGYHDDVLIGYGSAALQSSCRSSHEYWGHP
jgi:oxygen-independent coproporphyrinogen-3 oxidase